MEMKSEIHITPVSNIVNGKLLDKTNVVAKVYNTDNDSFTFINVSGETREDTLINASLYDDTLLLDGKHYRILHMLSK